MYIQEPYITCQKYCQLQKGLNLNLGSTSLLYSQLIQPSIHHPLGAGIMHFYQNLIMWASGYDYKANPKTFLL